MLVMWRIKGDSDAEQKILNRILNRHPLKFSDIRTEYQEGFAVYYSAIRTTKGPIHIQGNQFRRRLTWYVVAIVGISF